MAKKTNNNLVISPFFLNFATQTIKKKMNILVIRFRQMGDAILTTVILNSLKKSFPGCSIDFVLNDKICPLFERHPSIDKLIPFSEEEQKAYDQYLHSQGIDLNKPILLTGVTAKLDYKTWNEDRMAWTIQKLYGSIGQNSSNNIIYSK